MGFTGLLQEDVYRALWGSIGFAKSFGLGDQGHQGGRFSS